MNCLGAIRLSISVTALSVACTSATAQTLGQAPEDSVSAWRVIAALFLRIALGAGAVFAIRARGGALPNLAMLKSLNCSERRLQLLEVLRVNPHVDICMIRCDGATMLLAASAHGVDVLPFPAITPHEGCGAEANT